MNLEDAKHDKSWTDWRWQLAHAVRNAEQLRDALNFSDEKYEQILQVLAPKQNKRVDEMRLTPFLLSHIDQSDPHDPIALQHIPDVRELEPDTFSLDEVWEQDEDFYDGENRMIQQKYPDIILLRLSNTCNSYCRFCFQKERTLQSSVATSSGENEFEKALSVIQEQTTLRQVLISGGDPLIISDDILLDRLYALARVPHITTLRINTRVFVHNPFRITPELCARFKQLIEDSWKMPGRARGIELEIGAHFNHPRELTSEAINAIRELQKNNVGIYNQSVILKNVNDNAEVVAELFRMLRAEAVHLHYVSISMPVPGTSYMRTSVRKVQEIMRELHLKKEFRGQLPQVEMSHYTGKHMVPATMNEFFYEDEIDSRPVIRFVSDITGEWEIFPDGPRE